MFERLKAVFSLSSSEPDFPVSVWALTVLLNPDLSKILSPTEAVDFAVRNLDDIAEYTRPLYFGGTDDAKTIDLFTAEGDACDYVGILSDWRTVGVDDNRRATFGLVLLRREILYSVLEPIGNLKITLDIGLPNERVVPIEELQRYIKD